MIWNSVSHSLLCAITIALPVSMFAGCAVANDGSNVDEKTATSTQALSVYNWSTNAKVPDQRSWQSGGGMATLEGVPYLAHTGEDNDSTNLWWSRYENGAWLKNRKIEKQWSRAAPELATYGKELYMFHLGESYNSVNVWMSRFDKAADEWLPNVKLAFSSTFSPAAYEYGGRLYLFGVDPLTKKIWTVTMDENEQFSPEMYWANTSVSPTSVTTYNGGLMVAHCDEKAQVVTSVFSEGRLGGDDPIGSGKDGQLEKCSLTDSLNQPYSTYPHGYDKPTIAAHGGYVHLLNGVAWSYFNGGYWSTRVVLPGQETYGAVGMTDSAGGLVMVHTSSTYDHQNFLGFGVDTQLYYSIFQ